MMPSMIIILSENFKMTYRSNEEDFIRSCIITFPILILLILNFSGKIPHAIEQDFHATVFIGNNRTYL